MTELIPASELYASRLDSCLKRTDELKKIESALKRTSDVELALLAGMETREDFKRSSDGLIEAGDFGPQALAVNKLLTQIDSSQGQYWSRLGRCYESSGDLDKAQDAFQRVLKIDPTSSVPRRRLEEITKWRDARRQVTTVFDEEGPQALRSLIRSMKDVPGKTHLRLEGRRLLFEQTGADVWDWLGLASEVGRTGAYEQALGLYREAFIQGDPEVQAAAMVGAAAVLRRMNRSSRAEKLCRQVLESYPSDAFALRTLGAALADQKRLGEADTAFTAAQYAEQSGSRRE